VGRDLKDRHGIDVGEINSLVIDTQNGAVEFVMIKPPSSFNDGGQLIAAPWSALQSPFGSDGPIITKVGVDKLAEAPRVDRRRIFELNRPQQRFRVYGYYGYRYPYDAYGDGPVGPNSAYDDPRRRSDNRAFDSNGTWGSGTTGNAARSESGQQNAQNQKTQTNRYDTQNRQSGLDHQHLQGDRAGKDDRQADQHQSTDQNQQAVQNQQDGSGALVVARDGVVAKLEQGATTSATALQNAEIYATNGDEIGDIDEVMIDVDRGQVAYILVSRGGFLGIDQSWYVVPVEALVRTRYRDSYRLVVDEQALSQEPALHVDRQNLPTHLNAAQLATLYQHFQIRPYWEQASQQSDQSPQTTGKGKQEQPYNPQ